MSNELKKRFTVIKNDSAVDKSVTDPKHFHTNPIAQDLRKQLMEFTNNEAGARFTVEDLLKW